MTKPVEAGSLKRGHYVVIDGEPCRIIEIERSKPGKHGAAKVRIDAIGIFDQTRRSMVSPVDMKLDMPILERRSAQVISVAPTAVQLMDLETYDVFWIDVPPEEDIRSELSSGVEVEYMRALGKSKITRVK